MGWRSGKQAKGGDWESKPDQPEERRVGKGRRLKKEKEEKEKMSSRDGRQRTGKTRRAMRSRVGALISNSGGRKGGRETERGGRPEEKADKKEAKGREAVWGEA